MIWVEAGFVQALAGRVRNFRRVGSYVWNFTCPLPGCDDGGKHGRKSRGYVYQRDARLLYFCHHCSTSWTFRHLLREVAPDVSEELELQLLTETGRPAPEVLPDETFKLPPPKFEPAVMRELTPVSELGSDHLTRQYVSSRLIRRRHWGELYHCEEFFGWAAKVRPDREWGERRVDEPRLVIPFVSGGEPVGFQGRALGPSQLKYVSVVVDETRPMVWGLDLHDGVGDIIALEGPIDAMLVDNAVAMAGSDMLSDLRRLDLSKERVVVVYDNEPRSPHTVKKMLSAARAGYRVCVWPDTPGKDVNDMVLKGVTSGELRDIISSHSYEGVLAEMMILQWRRCELEEKRVAKRS